jgi:hypothetical protein
MYWKNIFWENFLSTDFADYRLVFGYLLGCCHCYMPRSGDGLERVVMLHKFF